MRKERSVPFDDLEPVISISESLTPRVMRLDWQDCLATLFTKKKDAKSCYFQVSDDITSNYFELSKINFRLKQNVLDVKMYNLQNRFRSASQILVTKPRNLLTHLYQRIKTCLNIILITKVKSSGRVQKSVQWILQHLNFLIKMI